MENNLLPSKTTNGLLNKFRNFFKSLFNKSAKLEDNTNEINEKLDANKNEHGFFEGLKESTHTEEVTKEEFLENIIEDIEKEPEKLDNLTTEQLEDVDKYYTEKIEKLDEQINKLKK